MRDTMILAGILAGLTAGLATPLAAQDANPAGTAPPAPPMDRNTAPPMDKDKVTAAKLAGLVGFANVSCPDVQGDPALLKAAVESLGIDPKDLDKGELSLLAHSYLDSYRKDIPENCKRAIETFGPSSKIVPNLIVKR